MEMAQQSHDIMVAGAGLLHLEVDTNVPPRLVLRRGLPFIYLPKIPYYSVEYRDSAITPSPATHSDSLPIFWSLYNQQKLVRV